MHQEESNAPGVEAAAAWATEHATTTMSEAANICQLATTVLREHVCHPHYHRIGLSGIQGVEAVLIILQECYGWSYPGGLFLAAVDLLLEKEPVVRAVKQQLQRCTQSEGTGQQEQQGQLSTADSQAGSSVHASDAGSLPLQADTSAAADAVRSSREPTTSSIQLQQKEPLQREGSSGAERLVGQELKEEQQQCQHSEPPAAPASEHDSYKAAGQLASPVSADEQLSSRSTKKSPAGASSTASAPRSRSSTPATPPAARAGQLGEASSLRSAGSSTSRPYAAGTSHVGANPVASPISATSPVLQGAAARLAFQQQHEQQRGKAMDSFQRHQHQQLQHLLFDAPLEVFTASLAGSMRQIDLSAVNSPHQIQTQHELQQELSRSSVASAAVLKHGKQQWQQQAHAADAEQQQMLPLPQKTTEQQRLQETLQFARQPVQLPTSPVSTWQQWQQQQQLVVVATAAAAAPGSSPWRLQQQLQPQEQSAASPLAVPQPQHEQPPLSPPIVPPHMASPAVTPLPLQEQQQSSSPAATSTNRPPPQQPQAAEGPNSQGGAQQPPAKQQQNHHHQQQQQQPPLRRSPQQQQEQLQDLQELAGILQPVLFDDAAASEVLSEWLSGSDVAVADSEADSDAATTGPAGFVFQPPTYMVPMQPGSAASTAGAAIAASPPVAPHMLHFTPLPAAGLMSWQSREQAAAYSGDRDIGATGYASSPAPGSAALAAGAGAGAARGQQQAWSQQSTPSSVAAAQPYSTRHRTGDSSVAQGALRHVELSPGSSVTVQRATAADDQSLVLDIDLAKVLDSSGTIVLQVCRDETGALTAAAALAPAATPAGTKRAAAAAAAAAGGVGLMAPQPAASPVIGSRGRQGQQGLPLGSISVDGSIGAAAWGPGQHRQTAHRQNLLQQQGVHVEQPVHRVLRYSAEGCVSVDSTGPAVVGGSIDFAASQQQQQEPGAVRLVDATRSRQLGDAAWVLADIQPAADSQPEGPGAADSTNGSHAVAAVTHKQQQEQQQGEGQEGEQQQLVVVEDVVAHEEAQQALLASEKDAKPPGPDVPEPRGSRLATPNGSGGGANDLRQQAQLAHAWQQAAAAAGRLAHPHPHQQALLQGQGLRTPRTQRVSLEPPSTPLAGSVAGALLSAQHSDLAGAGQSSTFCVSDAGPLGAGEESATTFADVAGLAASTPAAAAAAAAPAAPAAAAPAAPAAAAAGTVAGTPATARGSGLEDMVGALGQSASPLPPELLSTETPARFKFWAAGRGGGGLRYTAAQQTLESLTNLQGSSHLDDPTGAAAAAAGQYGPEPATQQQEAGCGTAASGPLVSTADAWGAAQKQQQQEQEALRFGLLGQSLELLGLSDADLGQLGFSQVSLDLLGAGDMQHLELQMLKALGAAGGGDGGQQSAHMPAARALAASAVKLLRQSLAVAAAAAACQRAPAASMQQRPQQEGTGELPAAAAPAAAAPAATMALDNTRVLQSLELLPRQLLQSLQAAAAEAAAGGSTGSQAQALVAAVAAARALGLDQQTQVQDSALQQWHVGVQDSLTNWLADRFGADVNLQKSVSLLLHELEQQQPQWQQQATTSRHALLVGAASEAAGAVPEAAMTATQQQQQQQQQQQHDQQTEAGSAAGADMLTPGVGTGSGGKTSAAELLPAGGEYAGSAAAAAGWLPSAVGHHNQAGGAAGHDGDASEMCATASPVPAAWHAALAAQQLQQQHAPGEDHMRQQASPGAAEQQHHHQAQQQQQQEQEQVSTAPASYACWSNRVEQLLRVSQVSPEGDSDAAAAADLTEGSLGMTPSPSGYGPHPGYVGEGAGCATADRTASLGGACEGAVAGAGAAEFVLGEVCSVPSVFRTSVMTNPLYLVEPSTGDIDSAVLLVAEPAADAGAASAEQEEAAPEALPSIQERPPSAAAPQASPGRKAAAPQALLHEQDSREAAAILQQYLPYSSSSSSDGGGSPCGTGDAGSSSTARGQAAADDPHSADTTEAEHLPLSPAADSQPPASGAAQSPGSPATALQPSSSAAAQQASACSLDGSGAAVARAADDCQSTGRSAAESQHPGSARSSQPDLPVLFVADSGEVGVSYSHSSSAAHSRAGQAVSAHRVGHAGNQNTGSSSSAGQGSCRRAVSGSGSNRQGQGISIGSCTGGQASPQTPRGELYGSFCAAAEGPESAAGAASGGFGGSGSSFHHQQQQQQQRHLADSAAVAGSRSSAPRDWSQQPPRWQVVSELEWVDAHASQQQEDEEVQDWEWHETAIERQGQQGQAESDSPAEGTEVASEPSWGMQHTAASQELQDDAQQPLQHQKQQHWEEEASCGEEQQQERECEQRQGLQLPEPQSVSRIQRLMQQLRNRRKLQHAAASPAWDAPAAGVCGSLATHAGEPAAAPEPAMGASLAGEDVQSAGSCAVEDTLSAAEAAMQQALQRVQLLQGQQELLKERAQLQDISNADMQQAHETPPPQQQQPVQQQQPAAASWQAWERHMQHSEQLQLQQPAAGHPSQQQQPTFQSAAPLASEGDPTQAQPVAQVKTAAYEEQEQQDPLRAADAPQQLSLTSACSPAAAPAGAISTAAAAAVVPAAAAAAAAESPSVKWVREVLQGSSTFSGYVQALAHGDTNHSAHSKLRTGSHHHLPGLAQVALHGPAEQEEAEWGGGGARGAAAHAAGSAGTDGRRGPEGERTGLREQVAGRMSALLAAAQMGGEVRASCCSGSDISVSSMGSGSVAAVDRGPLSEEAVAGGGARQPRSMWQDKIQQLLAAADAAADSLTQPLSAPLPAAQQRRLAAAAGASKPPASRAAAVAAAGGRSAGLGLSSRAAMHSRGAAAVVGVRPGARQRLGPGLAAARQQQRQGGRVQAARSTKKPDKAAAAAAIVAARLALPAAAGAVRAGSSGPMKQLAQGHQAPCAEHSMQLVADTAAAKDSNQAGQQQQEQKALKQELQQQLQQERSLPQDQPHVSGPKEAVQDACPSGGAAEERRPSETARRRASLSLRGRLPQPQLQLQQEPARPQQNAPPQQEQGQQQHSLSTDQALSEAGQQPPDAAAHVPGRASGVAALAASHRERLQQLRLQQQQQREEAGALLQQRPVAAVGPSRDTLPAAAAASAAAAAAAAAAGTGSAVTLNSVSSRGMQVRPEDSAGMLSPNAVFTTRPSKSKQQRALLPVQGSLAAVLAAVGSGGGTGSVTAAAAATTTAPAAVEQRSSSMFDIRRPKGYTFSTAKARAAAELAGAEQPAAPQEQLPPSVSASTQPAGQPSRGNVGRLVRPAGACGGGGGAAVRDVSPGTQRSGRKLTPASSAAYAAMPAVQPRQPSGLQAEDSFSSQRSHGLSLRKDSRQPSPAAAAPAHKPQQMEPAGHSSFTVYSQQQAVQAEAATAAAGLTASGRKQQPQAAFVRGRAAGGRGSSSASSTKGSTTAGAVAAVAAVKAALSGFGNRGWQQQDVCSWLNKLRLDMLPEEPTAPLLSNPLRNGLLLAGVAASVTLQPLQGIRQPVASLAAARCNLLMAAARLSLISVPFAGSAAVAAAQHNKGEALRGLGLSQGGLHPAAVLAMCDSPVLRPGVLVGSPVRCQGRSSVGGSPAKAGGYCRSRSVSPNRSYVSNSGSSGGGGGGSGLVLDSASTCRCLLMVATGPGLAGSCAQEQPQQQGCGELASVLCSPASSCCCDCWACQQLQGSVLEHAVLQLLELTLAGDTSCMWGLLYALQQAYPVVPGSRQAPASPVRGAGGAARGRAKQGCTGSPQKQQARQVQQEEEQQSAAGASGAGSGRITVQPLQGPSWRRFQLPYTAAELDRLEHHLLQWLEELDIICAADTPDWSCLSTELSSGVLLAEVAAAVGLPHAVGVQERPVTAAARAANIQAVLDVLRPLPGWPGRSLLQQHSHALTAGERPALTALLEALWVWTTGQQQGSWLRWLQPQQPASRSRAGLGGSGITGTAPAASAANGSGRAVWRSSSVMKHGRPL